MCPALFSMLEGGGGGGGGTMMMGCSSKTNSVWSLGHTCKPKTHHLCSTGIQGLAQVPLWKLWHVLIWSSFCFSLSRWCVNFGIMWRIFSFSKCSDPTETPNMWVTSWRVILLCLMTNQPTQTTFYAFLIDGHPECTAPLATSELRKPVKNYTSQHCVFTKSY